MNIAFASSGRSARATTLPLALAQPAQDPTAVMTGDPSAWADDGDYVEFTLENPTAVSTPTGSGIRGAYVEYLDLEDVFGAGTTDVGPEDLNKIVMWLGSALPVDAYVGFALTTDGVSSVANSGVFVGMQYNASGPQAIVSICGTVGWGAIAAGSSDPLGRGVCAQVAQGNGATNVRLGAVLMTAARMKSLVAAASPAPATGVGTNTNPGRWNRIALVAGWVTGSGGSAGAKVRACLRLAYGALEDIPGWGRFLRRAAPVLPALAAISRISENGDSNGQGTAVDTDDGGDTIATEFPNLIVRDQNSNLVTWPNGTTPSTGWMPKFLRRLRAAGAVNIGAAGSYYTRESANGALLGSGFDAQLNDTVNSIAALGLGDPHAFVLTIGANDAQNAGEMLLFRIALKRYLRIIDDLWRDAWIIVKTEYSTDVGTYPFVADQSIRLEYLARSAAEGLSSKVIVLNPWLLSPAPTMVDQIHYSTLLGGGQDRMAQQAVEQLQARAA